jgi:HD-GYP domain-containing protein (c-di-GMP phosphodiesterase class II)
MATSSTSNWTGLEARLSGLLRFPAEQQLLARLRDIVAQVAETADGHRDELVYLILRHDHGRLTNYGVAQSLHTSALCGLLAKRLEWAPEKAASLMGAALTMNLSILELQGALASRGDTPSEEERQKIDSHPADSARLLRAAGLADEDWLQTVEQHHEVAGGGGYPAKMEAPTEMSQLLRFVDMFTAKHSPRAGRTPVPAQQAARDLYLQGKRDPLVSVLIKELGIYPPGCYVRLANGEVGVVTHVGDAAHTPKVASFTTPEGNVLANPPRRDTALPAYAIKSTVPDSAIRVTLSVDKLYGRRTT